MKITRAAPLFGIALLFSATVAGAAQLFVIDPAQSSLVLSGTVVGMTVTEQGSGSLSNTLGGTLLVNVEGSSVSFPGGSQGIVHTNGSWEPAAGGAAGSAPANFAGKATSFLGNAKGALRNAQFDIVSESIPLNGEAFAASALTFAFRTNEPAPVFDYFMASLLGNQAGAAALSGWATNQVVTNGFLRASGDSLVLTIPVDAQFPLNVITPGDSVLVIKGKLVAVSQAQPPPGVVIGGISVGAQSITLTWVSEPNQEFRVFGSPDLLSWLDRSGPVTSTTTNYSWAMPLSSSSGFFRLSRP